MSETRRTGQSRGGKRRSRRPSSPEATARAASPEVAGQDAVRDEAHEGPAEREPAVRTGYSQSRAEDELDDEDDYDRERHRDDDLDEDEDERYNARERRDNDRNWDRERPREGRGDRDTRPRDSRGDRDRRGSHGGRREGSSIDEYALQVYFVRDSRQFHGTVLEFPEVRASGAQREAVIRDLESRLEAHLQKLRSRGEAVPEAISARRFPERLEARISQNLQRKLEVLSRTEKIGLDQLVSELLAAGVERREAAAQAKAAPRSQPQPRQQQQRQGGNTRSGNQAPRHGNRRLSGRAYQDTINKSENFLEYVRNLEKSGGTPGRGGGWGNKK